MLRRNGCGKSGIVQWSRVWHITIFYSQINKMMIILASRAFQSLMLSMVCVVVWWLYLPRSTMSVIKETLNACEFSAPGEWREGPYPPAVSYCPKWDGSRYRTLAQHMRYHSIRMADHDVLMAPEFGSHVRAVYVKRLDEVLYNLEMVNTGDGATQLCADDFGGGEIHTLRPKDISVRYVDESGRAGDRVFRDGDACLLQSAIEMFAGLSPVSRVE